MTKDILIWGAGAIGGTVGAYLKRAGHDVTFVDIETDHVAAIGDPQRGLRIDGSVDQFNVVAPAFTPATLAAQADDQHGSVATQWRRIFLAVKAQHTDAACRQAARYLHPEGYVLSLQNGLCEGAIAQVVGAHRTIGAFINFGADWIGPGEILYANRGAAVIGELDGQLSERLAELKRDLQSFEPDVIATDDIDGYLWGKLGYASLLFAQALGDQGIADCLARPELLPLWRRLVGEVMEVAQALDIRPRGFNGFAPEAFPSSSLQDPASEIAAKASVAAMVAFNRPNAKTHSGIWRDLAVRKRVTEVDMQIGAVIALGHDHGLPCPALTGLVKMIHQIETGKLAQSDNNLNALMTP